MTTKWIHQVLVEHETHTDWFRRRGGYCWPCSCETDGEDVHRTYAAASSAAAWHVAEQLAAALDRDAAAQQTRAVEQLSEVLGVPVAEVLDGGRVGGGRR